MPYIRNSVSFDGVERAGQQWAEAQAAYISQRRAFDRTRFTNRLEEETMRMKMKVAQASAKAAMAQYYDALDSIWKTLKGGAKH